MYLKHRDGTLEVITGPMFAGKSEELIKRIKTLSIAKMRILVLKPHFDNRFGIDNIVSRNGEKIKAHNIKDSDDIYQVFDDSYDVVAIDEVHFFDEKIIQAIEYMVNKNKRVIVSGLDMDFLKRPFGIMPQILSIADEVSKLKAVCVVCHSAAGYSFRKFESLELNVLGDKEYEARCRHCHDIGMKFIDNKN
ncbi:thymidine kinase [Mycoplasmopsis ciconiae]|uniref:Thymidine kinase n=1 Tax=Mycoplasmopsis ciconiae TaxID=561067 RepID=A0ABU7ML02_9BACT|nr:thymidine kinase [Mycoplasmopsis ciconiae]